MPAEIFAAQMAQDKDTACASHVCTNNSTSVANEDMHCLQLCRAWFASQCRASAALLAALKLQAGQTNRVTRGSGDGAPACGARSTAVLPVTCPGSTTPSTARAADTSGRLRPRCRAAMVRRALWSRAQHRSQSPRINRRRGWTVRMLGPLQDTGSRVLKAEHEVVGS